MIKPFSGFKMLMNHGLRSALNGHQVFSNESLFSKDCLFMNPLNSSPACVNLLAMSW